LLVSPGSLRCSAIVCARFTGQLALLRYCMRATHRAACAAPLLCALDSPGSLRCSAIVFARITGQLALLRYCVCSYHRAACAAPLLYALDLPGSLRCSAIVILTSFGVVPGIRDCRFLGAAQDRQGVWHAGAIDHLGVDREPRRRRLRLWR
jgi:hypothetical protein